MKKNVVILDKKSTIIDNSVTIGENVIIHPSVSILGSTSIGSGCTIFPGSVITDSKIGEGSIIKSSYIDKSDIGEDNTVGPFANVRAGTVTGDNVKIGAFCETKKVVIGAKTKISHLAYVGDAVIGRACNIACGVVFANYNGKIKQKVCVGDNSFIGCNVNLIAPVNIEAGAYICAGSTVTQNIPSNAFVVGRAREIIKENRASAYLNLETSKNKDKLKKN